MSKTTLVFILLLGTVFTYGQNTTDGLNAEFFKKYEQDTDSAFDYIFGTNKWMEENKSAVENVKFKIREYKTLMGEYIGFERLSDRSLGESLKVSVYLVKYERQPLRFIFKYYKARDNWVLYNFKFDESIDDDLDEIMKYEYLNEN